MRLDCTVEEGYRELAEEALDLLRESFEILEREILGFDDEEEEDPRMSRSVLERKRKQRNAIIHWTVDLNRLKTREITEVSRRRLA